MGNKETPICRYVSLVGKVLGLMGYVNAIAIIIRTYRQNYMFQVREIFSTVTGSYLVL